MSRRVPEKFKKPKISAETSRYRLYVKFLPQYQNRKHIPGDDGTFSYLSDDYHKDPKRGLRKMLERVMGIGPDGKKGRGTITDRYYRAMLYEEGKEKKDRRCLAVWIPGKGRLTYDQYLKLFEKKDLFSLSPIRAWIKA